MSLINTILTLLGKNGGKFSRSSTTVIWENKEAYELLEAKGKIVDKGRELQRQIEDLVNRQNILANQAQRIIEKISRKIDKEIELNEFEVIGKIELESEGKIKLIVTDYLEDFKIKFKAKHIRK